MATEQEPSAGPEKGAGAQDVLSLEAISGPCEGTVYSKAGDVLSVGRTRASKLHIKDAAVSERHAEVRWETDRWTVTDVGSSNGTAVNGQPLIEGLPTQLKDGDIILFGSDSQLRVHLMPASDEGTTVEQHLRAECRQWTERIRGRAEQHANELLSQWKRVKEELLAAG